MPLRSLVVIALRVYAIYWLTVSISELLIYIPTMLSLSGPAAEAFNPWWSLTVPVGMLAIAALIWGLAARLSGAIVKGEETQLVFTTLTRHDFYLSAFIFLGLYFVLSSVAATIRAGYDFYAYELVLPDSERKGQYLIPLVGHLVTIAAGLACIFRGRKWTHRLIQLDNKFADKVEAVSPEADRVG